MDITVAYQARRAGRRREVAVHRGALRLTNDGLAELHGHIEQLTARFADPGADGTWTRVVMTLIDLQDRPDADPPPRSLGGLLLAGGGGWAGRAAAGDVAESTCLNRRKPCAERIISFRSDHSVQQLSPARR